MAKKSSLSHFAFIFDARDVISDRRFNLMRRRRSRRSRRSARRSFSVVVLIVVAVLMVVDVLMVIHLTEVSWRGVAQRACAASVCVAGGDGVVVERRAAVRQDRAHGGTV